MILIHYTIFNIQLRAAPPAPTQRRADPPPRLRCSVGPLGIIGGSCGVLGVSCGVLDVSCGVLVEALGVPEGALGVPEGALGVLGGPWWILGGALWAPRAPLGPLENYEKPLVFQHL